MNVTVKFYAGHRKLVGKETLRVTLTAESTVGHLLKILTEKHPPLAEVLGFSTISVNHRQAKQDTILREGDIVLLFPHIGGG